MHFVRIWLELAWIVVFKNKNIFFLDTQELSTLHCLSKRLVKMRQHVVHLYTQHIRIHSAEHLIGHKREYPPGWLCEDGSGWKVIIRAPPSEYFHLSLLSSPPPPLSLRVTDPLMHRGFHFPLFPRLRIWGSQLKGPEGRNTLFERRK